MNNPIPAIPMSGSYVESMRVAVEEGCQLSHANGIDLLAEVERCHANEFRLFHNALRILMSIDQPDFPGSDAEWQTFRANPHRYFITASDAQAAKLWQVIQGRQVRR